MDTATSSCPAALSFIFKPVLPAYKKNGAYGYFKKYGSIGVGCTVDRQVQASVLRADKNILYFNNRECDLPTVFTGLRKLTKTTLKISITSELPLGCGFGISGASVVSTLISANKLLGLNFNSQEIFSVAHYAEIVEKTGLGTVVTQFTGGFLLKQRPGIPPIYRRLNFTGRKIYATVVSPLKTPKILQDKKRLNTIKLEAELAMSAIGENKSLTFEEVFNISYKFCLGSGLLQSGETKNIIDKIRQKGGSATMAILGNTVLSTIAPFPDKYRTFELSVSDEPANKIL